MIPNLHERADGFTMDSRLGDVTQLVVVFGEVAGRNLRTHKLADETHDGKSKTFV